jgi:hypothetical protein
MFFHVETLTSKFIFTEDGGAVSKSTVSKEVSKTVTVNLLTVTEGMHCTL